MDLANFKQNRDKNRKHPQVPFESDGQDIEFADELADYDDIEAAARAAAASRRVEAKKHQ